jgi:8-oxo-dGTP pyrophosphatase MutT (NUDIX family)
MISDRISCLFDCLGRELPGEAAQGLMAPSVRPPGLAQFDGSQPRSSGVMILLFPAPEGLSTVFILRTEGGPHGGQISLPGGKQEQSDADLVATARRETQEEIGVDAAQVRDLGLLTPLYVPHSNYIIQPVVGYLNSTPVFVPDKQEVAGVISCTLEELFAPENRKNMVFHRSGFDISAPYYNAGGHRIWGATAMIMSEFERIFISCIS